MTRLQVSVVGAGNVGRGIAKDFIESDGRYHVRVFDVSQDALDTAGRIHESRVSTAQLNADDPGAVAEAVAGSAVVVNATDGTQCMSIMDGAIAARVNYIDVHGVFLYERLERREQVEKAGITAMLGMGFSPGVANMLGSFGARHVPGKTSIDIEYVTHRSLNSSPGLLETALRQFYSHVRSPLFEDGELKELKPFEGRKIVRFPTLNEEVELVCTPHSEPRTIPLFVDGLSRVSVRGTYHPEVMRLIRALHDFGLMDDDLSVTVEGKQYAFRPILRQALMGDGKPKPEGLKPVYIMRVTVTGEDGGETRKREYVMGNPEGWDPLPQGRMTALPTSYAAQLIATGQFVDKGITGPEMMSDSQVKGCIEHLRARGLWYQGTVWKQAT